MRDDHLSPRHVTPSRHGDRGGRIITAVDGTTSVTVAGRGIKVRIRERRVAVTVGRHSSPFSAGISRGGRG